MKNQRRFNWRRLLGILLSLLIMVIITGWPGSSRFTVSQETTFVTGPLDEHGYVDYLTALNERLRGNIAPEQNANVLIWQAIGPTPEGANMPPGYFQWLGIDEPPKDGSYAVEFVKFIREKQKITSKDGTLNFDEWHDRQSRAIKWPWSAKDEPEIAEWVQRNEHALTVIAEATHRPEYFNPWVPRTPGLMNSLLPNVQRCREIAMLLACRAMHRLHDGRLEAAWADLLTCHRLGRLLARGGSLIEALVGIAIDHIASTADLAYLHHAQLTKAQLTRAMEDLGRLPPIPPIADKIDLAERFVALEMVMLICRFGPNYLEDSEKAAPAAERGFWDRLFSRSVNWDPALRTINQWYDRLAAAARITDRNARTEELHRLFDELEELRRQAGDRMYLEQLAYGANKRGEKFGNILIGLILPAVQKVVGAADRCHQTQRNLQIAFALAAFRMDHGRYPATLDQLAPRFLPTVANDVFSGKPLNYRVHGDGYILYSVGQNEQDDEGRSFDDVPRGDDLVVQMPAPAPKRK